MYRYKDETGSISCVCGVSLPKKMNKEQKSKILSLLIGKYSYTKDSDPDKIIDYFEKNFIIPLKKKTSIEDKVLLDVSCGFGWMVFAYLKQGGKFAYGVDMHDFSVESSKKIAKILRLNKKCKFNVGNIEKLEFKDKSIDISSTIETLEHVKKQKLALDEIKRVTKEIIVITTPNGLYPKDIHNSGMYLGNYMPKLIRRIYMNLKKKESNDLDTMTKVMNPLIIEYTLKEFKVVSSILCFDSLSDWLNSRPHYSPYGYGRNRYVPEININSLRYKTIKTLHHFLKGRTRYLFPEYQVILERKHKQNITEE